MPISVTTRQSPNKFGYALAAPSIRGKLLLNPAPVSRAVLDTIAQAVTLQRKMDTNKWNIKMSFRIGDSVNLYK